jgi:hypothetical protein
VTPPDAPRADAAEDACPEPQRAATTDSVQHLTTEELDRLIGLVGHTEKKASVHWNGDADLRQIAQKLLAMKGGSGWLTPDTPLAAEVIAAARVWRTDGLNPDPDVWTRAVTDLGRAVDAYEAAIGEAG